MISYYSTSFFTNPSRTVHYYIGIALVYALALILPQAVVAQSGGTLPPQTSWTYSTLFFGDASQPHMLYVDRDTIVDGKAASIVEQREEGNFVAFNFEAFGTIVLRQEGDTLLQYLDGDFRILDNYDVAVGDTVRRYVPVALRNRNANAEYITYRVDTVGTLQTETRDLRGYYLRILSAPNDVDGSLSGGWRYESIGNHDGYLLPYGYFFCDGGCPRFIRCFSAGGDGGDAVSYRTVDQPCDALINSVTIPDISHRFTLSPNPAVAGGEVTLQTDATFETTKLQTVLLDAAGRRVVSTVHYASGQIVVAIPATVSSGVYTLVLLGDAGRAVKRLVVLPGR